VKSRSGPIGVAARLALLLGGVAAFSTGLALVVQDRALDQDLKRQSRTRLEASARRADRLIVDHLEDLAERYTAISRTPELRANLGTRHGPTLGFYAGSLLRGERAILAAFVGPQGEWLAEAGDPRLVSVIRRSSGSTADTRPACVRPDSAGPSSTTGSGDEWKACEYPLRGAEASLLQSDGGMYALVRVPLRTRGVLDGGLFAVEAVSDEILAGWSELSGADVRAGGSASDGELDALVKALPGIELRVATTYDAELSIIRRARNDLVLSGALALLLALVASLFLARDFARPIVRIREATERLSKGQLDHRVEVERADEIGQLGHAFNDLASRLTASQERERRAQRLARFGNWQFDFETQTFEGTEEFHRLFSVEQRGGIPLSTILDRIRPEDREAFEGALGATSGSSSPFQVDVSVRGAGGKDRVLHLRGQVRSMTPGQVDGSAQDVTDRRQSEEQIRYLSLHDPLTGLGNRNLALEEIEARVAGRDGRQPFVLMVIALDDLSQIVQTFGHAVGDTVLVDAASRLVLNVRERPRADDLAATDLVARLGDDRFLIVLDGVTDTEGAAAPAGRLQSVVRRPYRVGDQEVVLTPSLGMALWPVDAETGGTLLRNAETALSRVQHDDPGSFRFFQESMHADASRRLRLAHRLRLAIEEEGLEFHYQPRVRPEDGALIGMEALARWTDADLGPISPVEFIPIAEATGTIRALGSWGIGAAARQLLAWHEAGHRDISVSVNLSHQQLEPGLVAHVLACTDGLDPQRFELEVTESALIQEGDSAIETLTQLRGQGFRIALDDFGTGYSSLAYLQGLPIDTVKVDRSFIRDIADDADAAALTGSVLAMCRALRLHTVVEGVETEAQLRVLEELGCTEVQGFLFSRPLPVEEATAYLERIPAAGGVRLQR